MLYSKRHNPGMMAGVIATHLVVETRVREPLLLEAMQAELVDMRMHTLPAAVQHLPYSPIFSDASVWMPGSMGSIIPTPLVSRAAAATQCNHAQVAAIAEQVTGTWTGHVTPGLSLHRRKPLHRGLPLHGSYRMPIWPFIWPFRHPVPTRTILCCRPSLRVPRVPGIEAADKFKIA